jgi:hypothetical protein
MSKNESTRLDKAREFLHINWEEMKKKYDLDGYATGYKIKQGKYTDTKALIFYVKKKKSINELASGNLEQIPREIYGIPTDVVARPKGIEPRHGIRTRR